MSIVLPNCLFIQVLAVFLDHVEKLLGKITIEFFVSDLSYDQIKNLVPEEIQGMCTLNSLMEFISWTNEGPEFTTNCSKNPCGFTLSLLIYTSKYALK